MAKQLRRAKRDKGKSSGNNANIASAIKSADELFDEFSEHQHETVKKCCKKFGLTNGHYSLAMAKRIIKIHKCVETPNS